MIKKHLASALFGLALMGAASCAMAADDYNKTIAAAGIQSGNGYLRTNEQLSVGCLYGIVYIWNVGNDAGQRAMYGTVLAAQAAGQKISHLGYTVDASGACMATLVEVAS
jgi:hypothetical protein